MGKKHPGRPPPVLDTRYSQRLRTVYERDGGICHLCQMPVPHDAAPGEDTSPTVDHLVPVAFGGTHEIDNLRLAHRLCNNVRGNRPMWTIPVGTYDSIWR